MRVWVGIILVSVGIIVCSYPEYQHMREEVQQQRLLISLTEKLGNPVEDMAPAREENADLKTIESMDGMSHEPIPQATLQPSLNVSSDKPSAAKGETPNSTGIIEIPRIKLKLPILEGVEDKILKVSAGHFPETALPGKQGNTAIAAHRSYRFGQMFNRLNELEINDVISISQGKQLYHYQVAEIKIVEPNDTSVLIQPEKGHYLTLVTCEPIFDASHRLIVRAIQMTF